MDDDPKDPEVSSEWAWLPQLRTRSRRLERGHRRPVDRSRAGLRGQAAHTELAELFGAPLDADATVEAGERRSPVLLSFESSRLRLDIEVHATGSTRRVLGRLQPPTPGPVELRRPGGVVTVEADGIGRFRVDDVDSGPLSVRYQPRGSDAPVVETDWFLA